MVAAFERAWSGDQRQRQRIAEARCPTATIGLGVGSAGLLMGRTLLRRIRGVNRGTGMGDFAGHIGRTHGPIVAHRRQHRQDFVDRARQRALRKASSGVAHGVQYHQIRLAAWGKRTEAVIERRAHVRRRASRDRKIYRIDPGRPRSCATLYASFIVVQQRERCPAADVGAEADMHPPPRIAPMAQRETGRSRGTGSRSGSIATPSRCPANARARLRRMDAVAEDGARTGQTVPGHRHRDSARPSGKSSRTHRSPHGFRAHVGLHEHVGMFTPSAPAVAELRSLDRGGETRRDA